MALILSRFPYQPKSFPSIVLQSLTFFYQPPDHLCHAHFSVNPREYHPLQHTVTLISMVRWKENFQTCDYGLSTITSRTNNTKQNKSAEDEEEEDKKTNREFSYTQNPCAERRFRFISIQSDFHWYWYCILSSCMSCVKPIQQFDLLQKEKKKKKIHTAQQPKCIIKFTARFALWVIC